MKVLFKQHDALNKMKTLNLRVSDDQIHVACFHVHEKRELLHLGRTMDDFLKAYFCRPLTRKAHDFAKICPQKNFLADLSKVRRPKATK